jgi:hypothetical protein
LDEAEFLRRLRGLIGRECTHMGRSCRLVEILADEGALVMETRERTPPIQMDQYGQPTCRGNEIVQIPIFGRNTDELSEDLMDILACLHACVSEDPVR